MDRAAPATLPFPRSDALATYLSRFEITAPGTYTMESKMLSAEQAARSARTPYFDEITGQWWCLRVIHEQTGDEVPLLPQSRDEIWLAHSTT